MKRNGTELICPKCKSTNIAHFNLEYQDFTHRTMCHDCKEWSDGMSFEESDAHFKVVNRGKINIPGLTEEQSQLLSRLRRSDDLNMNDPVLHNDIYDEFERLNKIVYKFQCLKENLIFNSTKIKGRRN